jgi:hypothetical protein
MDYSQFTKEQLEKRQKEIQTQIDILSQQDDDISHELSHRVGVEFAKKLQQNIINFINS